jgi:hypothetical protein
MNKFFVIRYIDFFYPFFCGAVVGAWLCFFSLFPRFEAHTGLSFRTSRAKPPVQDTTHTAGDMVVEQAPLPAPEFSVSAIYQPSPGRGDTILDAYRNGESREWVIAFFTEVLKPAGFYSGTASAEAAAAILDNASAFNIPPSLAFALSWAESRFNPTAVNRSNRDGSIDRGLFQLNSCSFPQLKEADFFNPSVSAYYGMAHLRWCLDAGGSVVAGLAMYNAGTGQVKNKGAPKKTLDYVALILEVRQKIEETFAAHPLPEPDVEEIVMETVNLEEAPKEEPYFRKLRLALLTPIAGKF